MLSQVRLAIADDLVPFRAAVRRLLELQTHLVVAAEYDDETISSADLVAKRIDVLLLYGNESTDPVGIRNLCQTTATIVVLPEEAREESMRFVRGGARAVVFKRLALDELIDAIAAVAAGHVWVPPALQAQLVAGLLVEDQLPLTPRELEITRCVARDMRNAEIARALFITEQTVKTHLNNIFHKLNVRDRVGLTLLATRAGLVQVQDCAAPQSGKRSAA
jgi:DNA-binding NarL/FixJ family response regulator